MIALATRPPVPQGAPPCPLRLHGIEKRFGGISVLKSVDFELERGEVHALIGENGAGKSTFVKIIAGAYRPDGGTIEIEGVARLFRGPSDARDQGVVTMYQETSLHRDLSVLENMFVGGYLRNRFGVLDWGAMRAKAHHIFERIGADVPLDARVADIGKAHAQLVEIARALLRNARILIMDEPTAALTAGEVDRLFAIVEDLKSGGTSIIYISHRLEEISRIADRVTVFRDGLRVGTERVANVTSAWLIESMLGHSVDKLYPRTARPKGRPLLEVQNLTSAGKFQDVSFTVCEGEIVGLAGLIGAGRSEVMRSLFGIDPFDSGTIRLDGRTLDPKPWKAIEAGVGLLPEDRGREGLIMPMSMKFNLSVAALRGMSRFGFVDTEVERSVTANLMHELDIRPARLDAPVQSLSGGNQQRVVLGKWLAISPKILVLDEPTQGVDVGAKAEIHRLIDNLRGRGVGVLMVSSDLPEVLGMSDRILVMSSGCVVATFDHGVSPDAVMISAGSGQRANPNVH